MVEFYLAAPVFLLTLGFALTFDNRAFDDMYGAYQLARRGIGLIENGIGKLRRYPKNEM